MGHHYIPRYYLHGFSTPTDNGLICVYDKRNPIPRCLPIKSVAQKRDYYTQATEKYLAGEIEKPAIIVIKKIREQQQMINPEEKEILSIYISIMMTRVPKHRERIDNAIPGIRDSVFAKIEERLNIMEAENRIDLEVLRKRRAEMVLAKAEYEGGLPDDLYESMTQPTIRPRIAQVLNDMTWMFITRDGDQYLVTSDNPVFYFSNLGIGNPTSEVSFPITTDILLWATHRQDFREGYIGHSNRLFKEINKRTIANATRFVFASRPEEWITSVIGRTKQYLRRIE